MCFTTAPLTERRGRLTSSLVFFFNDTATTEIYTLSLHDALPISLHQRLRQDLPRPCAPGERGVRLRRATRPSPRHARGDGTDRKSTRLNSSHLVISYAVFCLKKKKVSSGHT